jgi:hypothetical protein
MRAVDTGPLVALHAVDHDRQPLLGLIHRHDDAGACRRKAAEQHGNDGKDDG